MLTLCFTPRLSNPRGAPLPGMIPQNPARDCWRHRRFPPFWVYSSYFWKPKELFSIGPRPKEIFNTSLIYTVLVHKATWREWLGFRRVLALVNKIYLLMISTERAVSFVSLTVQHGIRLSIAGKQLALQVSKICVICFIESAVVLFRHTQLFLLTSAVSTGLRLFSIWLAVECHVQLTWNSCRTFSSPKNRFWK